MDANASDADLWNVFDMFHKSSEMPSADAIAALAPICLSCQNAEKIKLIEGNYICIGCGDMIERFIDSGAEWRYYGADDSKGNDPTRCGLPTSELLPDSSMGSLIGYTTKETYELRMMRRYHMWNSMSYKERSLYNIFDTLTVNAVNNGINKSIIDEAKMLYKQISELKISRGENRSGLIASSIYMACKRNQVPRSAKEIALVFNLKVTTMTKGCKRFQEMLKMNMNATGPADFIGRFCSKLDMDTRMRDMCKELILRADELSLISENTPPSIAAGAIYMCNVVYGWGITKKNLSESCDISQVTVTKCYSKLMTRKDELLKLCVKH
jgi:transcription initiation factor TFIIB